MVGAEVKGQVATYDKSRCLPSVELAQLINSISLTFHYKIEYVGQWGHPSAGVVCMQKAYLEFQHDMMSPAGDMAKM